MDKVNKVYKELKGALDHLMEPLEVTTDSQPYKVGKAE